MLREYKGSEFNVVIDPITGKVYLTKEALACMCNVDIERLQFYLDAVKAQVNLYDVEGTDRIEYDIYLIEEYEINRALYIMNEPLHSKYSEIEVQLHKYVGFNKAPMTIENYIELASKQFTNLARCLELVGKLEQEVRQHEEIINSQRTEISRLRDKVDKSIELLEERKEEYHTRYPNYYMGNEVRQHMKDM